MAEAATTANPGGQQNAGPTQTEAGQQQAPPAGQQQQAAPAKLAGKFENAEALAKGIRELSTALERPLAGDDETIIGAGGVFKTVEEAESAYKAMERMQGRKAQQAGQQQQPAAKPGDEHKLKIGDAPTAPDDVDSTAILAKAGLKNEDVVKEWQTSGKLSEHQYAAIQGVLPGVSKRMIDQYMGAQDAVAQSIVGQHAAIRQDAIAIAGGEQQLNNLLASARSFVPADEIEGLQQMIEDPKRYKLGLRILMNHHQDAVKSNKSKPLASGAAGAAKDGGGVIGSRDEYFQTIKQARGGNSAAQARLVSHRQNGGSRFS